MENAQENQQEFARNDRRTKTLPPPTRRYQLSITIEADSEHAAKQALDRCMSRFKAGVPDWVETDTALSGELSTAHNPHAPTGLAFKKALEDWSKKHGPAKGRQPADRQPGD